MSKSLISLYSVVFLLLPLRALAEVSVDPALPEYRKVSGITGALISAGSDTLANLMTLWAEEFRRLYPGVTIQVQAAGSSTAPPALTEGTSNLGPMSRGMKPKEQESFERKHGYKPTPIGVAIDALAVYVHKDNPLERLTIPQVDAIFSEGRRCGYEEVLSHWGQLGLEAGWAGQPIQLYGRNSVSGTYGYFKKEALCKGDFKDTVNEQPGSSAVVQSITVDLQGIGYSGIGYRTSGVKALALAARPGGGYVVPTPKTAVSGDYPLSRFLYVYVNRHPSEPLEPRVLEFMRMVLSRIGQQVVVKDGYVPLSASIAARELDKLL